MLSLFTKYLLQYKRVCIPYVGTFEIVQLSPQLNFADKIFTAPVFTTQYQTDDFITDHQVNFFAASNQLEKERLREELLSFGKKFKNRIKNQPFQWNGFGTLHCPSDKVVFDPVQIELPALQPVKAEKVMRGTDQQTMLVGDRQMTSKELSEVLHPVIPGKSWFNLTAWLIIILLVLLIAYILYTGHFAPDAAGLKTKAIG